jgi:hypothetical protein
MALGDERAETGGDSGQFLQPGGSGHAFDTRVLGVN